MNRRLSSACALVVLLLARVARGDEPPASAQPSERRADIDATPAAPAPPSTETAPTETPPATEPPKPSSPLSILPAVLLRAAAVGAYFQLFDIPVWGAGAAVSFGPRPGGKPWHPEVAGDIRFLQEVTPQGLFLEDVSARVSFEWTLGATGLRAGVGGGLMYLFLRRATTASFIQIPGLDALVRVGYDSGVRNRPFVLADFEVRAPLGGLAWGPTVQAGWRF